MRLSLFVAVFLVGPTTTSGETLRHPLTLEQQLKAVSPGLLAREARLRGDAQRGALVFFKSAAGCVKCHSVGNDPSPLGPNLTKLGKKVTDADMIESLLHPSKQIDDNYRTRTVLTSDGIIHVGLVARENNETLTMRLTGDLTKEILVDRDEIEETTLGDKSVMPDGLMASMADQREFLDLSRYVMEVAQGGRKRADELMPTAEELAVKDDSVGLDHAGIINQLRSRDFDAGKGIYHGYCFNCHGTDGNTPSLLTARAFGTQKLKFGSDPYSMFMTLTKGNGLMSPMSHLTPKERYQVVHYIREQFMRESNPDYKKVDNDYLAGLPKGTKDGTEIDIQPRDYGPALASQLERKVSSALTIDLGPLTVSYSLHSMDQAGIWRDGFLDLTDTQHYRLRGEGTAEPEGERVAGLSVWRWGHDGTLDYPTEGLLPRGPLPKEWIDYHGHYVHGSKVVLSYAVDGREILHLPGSDDSHTIQHRMRIGPGKDLIVALGDGEELIKSSAGTIKSTEVSVWNDDQFTAAVVKGESQGLGCTVDDQNRMVLRIPADESVREIEVICTTGKSDKALTSFAQSMDQRRGPLKPVFETLTQGGPLLWAETIETVGYRGLEQGGYALDTITIPDSTPWNNWFRTSAIDFFDDGRMVVGNYGGDIWIVSGVDDDLLNLKWKRFAAGLYEPMGLKVVDDRIYVTCKDRLTRLHDVDNNGEADFYESFSADDDVSVNFHAFNFDLQTDNEGNFYYAKSGHGTDSDVPGAVVKISADGRQRSIYCTGFRTPNGMGALPDGRVTASDNQGQWTPASKISLLKPGGFYGWVQTYSIPGMWEPGGGKIDISKVVPPEKFDQPLVWMPQEFDNSSGGQLFADDPRFGPLAGRMLHTSFGKGWMSYLMIQDFADIAQAAIIKLPFDFQTGIMRGRVNPADGQVYATGLTGWNGGGRVGLRDNGIQRLRYTGKPYRMVSDCQVERDGLRIEFNFPLDEQSATNRASWQAKHWNYHWRRNYGSAMYSPTTDQVGAEEMNVTSVDLSEDGRTAKLMIPDLKPVNQVHIILNVTDESGTPFSEEIYWTINRVP